MAEPSAVYQGNTPAIQNGGLNALQLALANYMAVGNPPPFAVNNAFMETMKAFTDPGELSPFDLDTKTGLPRVPDLDYTISDGISYVARGEDIYLLRRAQDCGPDENRLEEVFLGRRPDVAAGTWSFYGMIRGGSVAGGSTFSGGEGFVASLGTSIASGFTGDPANPSPSAVSVAAAIASATPGASIADVSAAVAAATGVGVNAATQATVNATQGSGFAGDPSSASSDGGDGAKVVCTAMNKAYGFGHFRNAIWLKYSQDRLTKAHEVGYHTLFRPLVKLGYEKDYRTIRLILEHIARHRTADLRAEMRGLKRRKLGQAYRIVLEPICWIVGKLKGH